MRSAVDQRRAVAAFTLLEIILALAILAGAIAVLGEVMSIAGRSASDAQAEAHAQLLASSMMDELLAGSVEMTNSNRQTLQTESAIPWVCTVTISDTTMVGLMSVEVLVEQDIEEQFRPVKYRLIRWVPTEVEANDEENSTDEAEADADA